MALPQITAPPEAPVFLSTGHGIEEDSVFAMVDMATGHSRTRRTWSVTQRIVPVEWLLEADEMAAVDAWWEETLQRGARTFAARVANQGAGDRLLWWEARWINFETEMMHLGRGKVRGSLFLIGEGTDVAPGVSLAAEIRVALLGYPAAVGVPARLAAEIVVALLQPLSLAAEIIVALTQTETDAYLRESTGYILREDGGHILRE